jgi:hypothetical protein
VKRRSFLCFPCAWPVTTISLSTLAAPIKFFLEGEPLSFSTPPVVEQGTTPVPFSHILCELRVGDSDRLGAKILPGNPASHRK